MPIPLVTTKKTRAADQQQLETIRKAFRLALQGCMKCEYDEAEGGIEIHCAECQLKVSQLAWRVFVLNKDPE